MQYNNSLAALWLVSALEPGAGELLRALLGLSSPPRERFFKNADVLVCFSHDVFDALSRLCARTSQCASGRSSTAQDIVSRG